MTRQGRLTVTGTQQDDSGGEQTTQTVAEARYYTKDGSSYIFYEEDAGDGTGIIQNRIRFKDGVLELTKTGAANVRMVFEPGVEHTASYSTPFGPLSLGILTDTVESVLSEQDFQICAAYSLICQDLPPQDGLISRRKIFIKLLFQG